jgi:hypothetical protein
VQRTFVDRIVRSIFDDPTQKHDGEICADMAYDPQIVANEDQRQTNRFHERLGGGALMARNAAVAAEAAALVADGSVPKRGTATNWPRRWPSCNCRYPDRPPPSVPRRCGCICSTPALTFRCTRRPARCSCACRRWRTTNCPTMKSWRKSSARSCRGAPDLGMIPRSCTARWLAVATATTCQTRRSSWPVIPGTAPRATSVPRPGRSPW